MGKSGRNHTKHLAVLILAAAVVNSPLLEARSLNVYVGSPTSGGLVRRSPAPQQQGPIQLVDCERLIAQDGQSEDVEGCFAIIEAAANSTDGIDMLRSIIESVGRPEAPRRPLGLNSHKTRRASSGHRSTGFVPSSQSSESLDKLLMGDSSGGYEFMDNGDKPIWPSAMSDEIQTRWQPMRGKRSL